MKGVLKVKGRAFVGLNSIEIFDGYSHVFTIPLKMIKRYGESLSSIFLELKNDIVIKTGKSDEVINFLKRAGIERCSSFHNLGAFALLNAICSASLISILIFFIPEFMPGILNILMKFIALPLIIFLGSLLSTILLKVFIPTNKNWGIDNELSSIIAKYSRILRFTKIPRIHILNSINRGFIAMALPFSRTILIMWMPRYCGNLCKQYIVAHELAHIRKKHVVKQISIYSFSAIALLIIAYTLITSNFNLFLIIFPISLLILIGIIIFIPYVQEADAHVLAIKLVGSKAFMDYMSTELNYLLAMIDFIDSFARSKNAKERYMSRVCKELLSVMRSSSIINRIELWISSFPHPPRYMLLNLANTASKLSSYKLLREIIMDFFMK